MTQFTRVLFSCLLISFVSAACSDKVTNSAPPAQKITSESVVKVAAQLVEIRAGFGEAIVRLNIQNGYHVNANPPTYPYLKATLLEIPPADGVSVSSVTYPKALEKKFPFADQPLAVYEGATDVKAILKADIAAKKGERFIPARLRIQACDNQLCYPPGTLELAIRVNIN